MKDRERILNEIDNFISAINAQNIIFLMELKKVRGKISKPLKGYTNYKLDRITGELTRVVRKIKYRNLYMAQQVKELKKKINRFKRFERQIKDKINEFSTSI
jgi:hypothetical protein